jgi:outer membrane protein OmpA-like peptidoglycan-associated protein
MSSRKLGANWEAAKEIPGEINTDDNEGAMTISPDGSYMVFTGCERRDGLGSCDLYISFFMNGQWTKPVNMHDPINTRFKETQPSISYDGRTLYFASNRPGTLGGLDLWMSTRDDNWNFGKPVNLGSVVNTKDDDQSPFIHTDNQTLYFCSRGHLGMGRNDIFVARKNAKGEWDSAVNIGYPINTVEDEPGLIVDRQGEYAYISSSNKNSVGGLDIFYFKLPKEAKPQPVTYLKGKVFDVYTKNTLASTFELVDLETGTTVNKSTTGKDGQFLVTLPGGKNYMLNVSSKGYLFYSQNLSLKNYTKTEPYVQDIGLNPIKAGEKITLNNIFFKTNSFELESQSKSELNKLVSFLKENNTVRIEISGHTDNQGTPEKNKTLSQNRAKAVNDYLVKEGILAARLIWKGYGETQPVAKNDTETGRAQNRRTEIKVIE